MGRKRPDATTPRGKNKHGSQGATPHRPSDAYVSRPASTQPISATVASTEHTAAKPRQRSDGSHTRHATKPSDAISTTATTLCCATRVADKAYRASPAAEAIAT